MKNNAAPLSNLPEKSIVKKVNIKSKKMYRIILINDLHCGHELGLTPPRYQSEVNRAWLTPAWDFYSGMIKQFGHVDAGIVNGDSLEGPGYKDTTHHIKTDIKSQIEMAVKAISLMKCDSLHIVKGTGFHVDGHTNYEEFIAKEFGVEAVDELRLDIYGRLFHVRHVVGRSDIPYGQHTQLQKEAINDILQAEFEDYKSADVIIRAHDHYCIEAKTADSTRGIMRHAYIAPALQLRGPTQSSFVRRLRTWKYDYGVTLIEVDPMSREVFIRPFIMPIKNYMKREYICLAK